MTANRNYIANLRRHGRLRIDAELETLILEMFGEEPYPYTYTDQDLHEQIRKLVDRYNREHPLPVSDKPWERSSRTASTGAAEKDKTGEIV